MHRLSQYSCSSFHVPCAGLGVGHAVSTAQTWSSWDDFTVMMGKWCDREGKVTLIGEWRDQVGRVRGTVGWEDYTEKVALRMWPTGWCNSARNAKEAHFKQRYWHVQRGRGWKEQQPQSSGYWRDSCILWKLDFGLLPSQHLAMFLAHTTLFHAAQPLPRWVLCPHAFTPSRYPCKLPSSSRILPWLSAPVHSAPYSPPLTSTSLGTIAVVNSHLPSWLNFSNRVYLCFLI